MFEQTPPRLCETISVGHHMDLLFSAPEPPWPALMKPSCLVLGGADPSIGPGEVLTEWAGG